MNENFSIKCENILENITERKKILLHSCCAPCSSYVISYLTKYFNIKILNKNKNIKTYKK